MKITKHGVMRFKERQKIKNNTEMERKASRAVEKGRLLKDHSNSPDIYCYLFDGFYYLVAAKGERLVTVFRPNKAKRTSKKIMLEKIRIKEFQNESKELEKGEFI